MAKTKSPEKAPRSGMTIDALRATKRADPSAVDASRPSRPTREIPGKPSIAPAPSANIENSPSPREISRLASDNSTDAP